MLRTVFVTSPSRGAGKTLVALALVRWMRKHGHRAIGLKPVDTGCPPNADHDLGSNDGKLLQLVSGPPDVPFTVIAPYRFAAVAETPAEAFDKSGLELTLAELAEVVRGAAAFADWAVVEGASTATTKLLLEHDELDLAAALGAQVLVVAADPLEAGRLSELVTRRKVPLLGVVLSRSEAPAGPGQAEIPALSGDLEARVLAAEAALEAAGLIAALLAADGAPRARA
ncbi:MAG: AAA family ATPase [Myxococcota bacterium]